MLGRGTSEAEVTRENSGISYPQACGYVPFTLSVSTRHRCPSVELLLQENAAGSSAWRSSVSAIARLCGTHGRKTVLSSAQTPVHNEPLPSAHPHRQRASAAASPEGDSRWHYLILLPVFMRIHCGMGRFCFCFLARKRLILNVLCDDCKREQPLVPHGSGGATAGSRAGTAPAARRPVGRKASAGRGRGWHSRTRGPPAPPPACRVPQASRQRREGWGRGGAAADGGR